MSRPRPIRALWLAPLIIAGCTGTPAPSRPAAGVTRAAQRPPDLSRPVARPAQPVSRSTSHLTVAVRPLGSVPFDGLTLPLTSPNGRYIAAQHGAMPSWDALLAAPTPEAAQLPSQLHLSAFEIVPAPIKPPQPSASGTYDSGGLVEVSWSSPPPGGLLIGRSCDDHGFLVEIPRSDTGARWIGKVSWTTGELIPLVVPGDSADVDRAVACFGTLTPQGGLAFCRAPAPTLPMDLVVRPDAASDTAERLLHPPTGATYVMPFFGFRSDRLFVFEVSALSGARMSLVAVDIPSDPAAPLTVVGRVEFNATPSIAAAYHSVSPLQTPPLPPSAETLATLPAGIAFASPETGSMVWWDGLSTQTTSLAKQTLGVAPVVLTADRTPRCAGLFLGTAAELVFQPLALDGTKPAFFPEAGVIQGAFLPRWVTRTQPGGAGTYLLLSPPLPTAPPMVGICEIAPITQ